MLKCDDCSFVNLCEGWVSDSMCETLHDRYKSVEIPYEDAMAHAVFIDDLSEEDRQKLGL